MNHRDQDGRRDYPSERGRDPQQTPRASRHGRGQSDYEEQPEYSARIQQGRDQGYQFGRDEYYGSRQFSERGQGSDWGDRNRNWEYEGGPERLDSSGYDDGQHESWNLRSMREQGAYGAGISGYQSERHQGAGQQRYGSPGTRDYRASQGQAYGRYGAYSSSSLGQPGGQRRYGRDFDYGDHGSRSVYGGESAGSGGRGSLYGGEYGEGSYPSGREERSSHQRYGSGMGRYDSIRGSSMSSPGYRGVGPKNYRRSDERLTEEINERLTDDDYLDASEITVRVLDGKVTLEGSVDQRWMKHMAEDIADACSGVKEVDNRITVTQGGDTLGRTSGARTSSTASTSSTTTGTGGTTGTMPH